MKIPNLLISNSQPIINCLNDSFHEGIFILSVLEIFLLDIAVFKGLWTLELKLAIGTGINSLLKFLSSINSFASSYLEQLPELVIWYKPHNPLSIALIVVLTISKVKQGTDISSHETFIVLLFFSQPESL